MGVVRLMLIEGVTRRPRRSCVARAADGRMVGLREKKENVCVGVCGCVYVCVIASAYA